MQRCPVLREPLAGKRFLSSNDNNVNTTNTDSEWLGTKLEPGLLPMAVSFVNKPEAICRQCCLCLSTLSPGVCSLCHWKLMLSLYSPHAVQPSYREKNVKKCSVA